MIDWLCDTLAWFGERHQRKLGIRGQQVTEFDAMNQESYWKEKAQEAVRENNEH